MPKEIYALKVLKSKATNATSSSTERDDKSEREGEPSPNFRSFRLSFNLIVISLDAAPKRKKCPNVFGLHTNFSH